MAQLILAAAREDGDYDTIAAMRDLGHLVHNVKLSGREND